MAAPVFTDGLSDYGVGDMLGHISAQDESYACGDWLLIQKLTLTVYICALCPRLQYMVILAALQSQLDVSLQTLREGCELHICCYDHPCYVHGNKQSDVQ